MLFTEFHYKLYKENMTLMAPVSAGFEAVSKPCNTSFSV